MMTREEKLYSMTMANLEIVADKLGIKINKKAAKSQAIDKILEAEAKAEKEWEEPQKKDTSEADKITEDNFNKVHKASTEPIQKPEAVKPKETTKKLKKTNLKLKELTYKGETKSIKEWAAEINMPWPTLYDRVNRNGWPVEKAIETPLGQRRPK